jgi:hypothetical protein
MRNKKAVIASSPDDELEKERGGEDEEVLGQSL